jgi:hypothetical protein
MVSFITYFLQDDSAPVGWDAIEPTSHLTLDQVRIDQLWKEHYDITDRAEERGYWLAIEVLEQASILELIDALMEGME